MNSISHSDLFIRGRTLSAGIYAIKLRLSMIASSNLTSSKSVYIRIIPSEPIIVNLMRFRISEITIEFGQDLLLEPGKYSTDVDGVPIAPDVNSEIFSQLFAAFCFC